MKKTVTYSRGESREKESFMVLRGSGTKDPRVKQIMRKYGFAWKEKSGFRRVMGYRAVLPVSRMVQVLNEIKLLGVEVVPSEGLKPNLQFILGAGRLGYSLFTGATKPSEHLFAYLHMFVGQHFDLESFVSWLGEHGYSKQPSIERTGDFTVRGGLVYVNSYGTPKRQLRIDWNGDQIEGIYRYWSEEWKPLKDVRVYSKSG